MMHTQKNMIDEAKNICKSKCCKQLQTFFARIFLYKENKKSKISKLKTHLFIHNFQMIKSLEMSEEKA